MNRCSKASVYKLLSLFSLLSGFIVEAANKMEHSCIGLMLWTADGKISRF